MKKRCIFYIVLFVSAGMVSFISLQDAKADTGVSGYATSEQKIRDEINQALQAGDREAVKRLRQELYQLHSDNAQRINAENEILRQQLEENLEKEEEKPDIESSEQVDPAVSDPDDISPETTSSENPVPEEKDAEKPVLEEPVIEKPQNIETESVPHPDVKDKEENKESLPEQKEENPKAKKVKVSKENLPQDVRKKDVIRESDEKKSEESEKHVSPQDIRRDRHKDRRDTRENIRKPVKRRGDRRYAPDGTLIERDY